MTAISPALPACVYLHFPIFILSREPFPGSLRPSATDFIPDAPACGRAAGVPPRRHLHAGFVWCGVALDLGFDSSVDTDLGSGLTYLKLGWRDQEVAGKSGV